MQALLRADGVPSTAIFREDHATSTLENVRFSLPLIAQLGVTRVILVTDATHAPRALLTARALGLTAMIATPSLQGSRKRTLASQSVRELVALPVYAFRIWRLKSR